MISKPVSLVSRRAILAGGTGLALATALAGCGQGGDDGALVLGDQAGLLQAKLKAAGLLDNLPFPHSWANFGGAAPLFEAIAAGAVDTGPAGDTPTIMAASQQVPIRIIAAARSGGGNLALLVPANSPIQTVQELRGRTVIVSSARGSIAHHLLLAALREVGVAPAEVKMGFMLPNDAAAAFEGGNVEAWATFGIYQAVAEVRGARVLRNGIGISSGIGLITASVKTLASQAKRASLTVFLERLATANRWTLANLDAYAAIYAQKTGVPLEVAQLVTRREDPRLQAADAGIAAELQKVADDFATEGVLPAPVNIAALIEPGLFKG
ncbi:ABC transporter substrate-binding protein [Niveispirillum sp. BGYR6]|uniref:ABC transporter substrate-binding protein n=1 Tax=Niveispirillum sp. BGYR6 TaxID=2971249 RepID=UPI0022B96E26|nr:ABC transporter substrate-binding protein [Niveispirillum sp. BGYR6]MDG5496135.1 ABC transporter substrate-binding protein [Niveispirillum sp. BGYR6]